MDLYKELEKNFPRIEKLFTEEMLLEFSKVSVYKLEKYKPGIGTMIRLKLLREKSPIYKKFVQGHITNREIMIDRAIMMFHEYINHKFSLSR